MYNYIPHPSNARQASMCVSLLIEEGFAGYGLYWAVLEVLRDAPDYRYSPDPRVWAYVLHASDVSQVERVLTRYGLFSIDDNGLMYSQWLCDQMGDYDTTKRKRQEAGRRGAASRWGAAATHNSNAIALPSSENSNAIAYNETPCNVTKDNITNPSNVGGMDWRSICSNQGKPVEPELFEAICAVKTEGHAPGWLAQLCIRYRMGENVLSALQELTNNAEISHPTYKRLVALVRRIQQEKWEPQQPANFFLSKLSES